MRSRPLIRALSGIALAMALVATTVATASAGVVSRAWTDQFGGSGTDIAHAVAVHTDRNVYVAGRIRAGGSDQCFLRAYRPDGSRRWTRTFGTETGEYCRGVAVAPNGAVYIAGTTSGSLAGPSAGGSDAFVRRYNASGRVIWTRQFGTSSSDQGYAVAVDGQGNVLVVGHTEGAFAGNTNHGVWDGFVRKLRSNGSHVWTRQFGTGANDFATGVAITSLRQVVVSGQTYGSLGAPYRGNGDAFVRAFRPNGNHYWTRQFGTTATDLAKDVTVAVNDRIYVVGLTEGTLPGQTSNGGDDGFIRKMRRSGATAWTRQFGTPGDDWAESVAADGSGNAYVAGRLFVVSGDGFVMKVRPDSTRAWIRKAGGGGSTDDARGVAVDRKRHVYIAGSTNGAFAGHTFGGQWDVWVRKYKP